VIPPEPTRRYWLAIAAALAVLCVTCALYWPVIRYDFVWDDVGCLRDSAWLRDGDAWKGFLFRNFCGWTNYFRPLAVALFVFEVRVFDVAPGPMHVMSLALHLLNTVLVGLLAHRWNRRYQANTSLLPAAAMLFFGVHPALVEPVTWISSQTELLLVCFVLLGLLANASIGNVVLRPISVALCFFLAACAKESAVAFPAVLVLTDWISAETAGSAEFSATLLTLWRRQWRTYLAVVLAGIAYLVFRRWGLGSMVDPLFGVSAVPPLVARLQEGSFAYLNYWRLLLWPMLDLGPTHVVDANQYSTVSAASVATDIAAMAIVGAALAAAFKRYALGGIVVAVTLVLLPSLHMLPVAFDASLYHARYAMLALALICAIAPRVVVEWQTPARQKLLGVATVLWLCLAVVNVRVTLPLWANDAALWQWDLRTNPDSIAAKEHLLAIAVKRGDAQVARKVLDLLGRDIAQCATCRIQAAYLAMRQGDLAQAGDQLAALKDDDALAFNRHLLLAYIEANGLLLELRQDLIGAEAAYRDAIQLDPQEPVSQMTLATVLARQGKTDEARQIGERAIALFAPPERDLRRKELERALSGSAAAHLQNSALPHE
jgi:tetratricopeptide (TPR) repeat protein